MLEEQIKNSNEESITRNISITKQYSKIIHVLVLLSKILIIISGLLSFSSTKFEYWLISFSSGSLNFLATSLVSYSSFLQMEKKKITKSLNQKLQIMGIKEKLLISNGSNDSDKSQWNLSNITIMDALLVKEIDIKQEIIIELNNIIIQQEEQINYYKYMLELLKESVNSMKRFLDDEN